MVTQKKDRIRLTVDDYRRESVAKLPKIARDYYESGSETEGTLRRNEAAFDNLLIRPRCLRSVENIDTSTSFLGNFINSPIAVAPTAFHRMATFDGEISTINGITKAGSIMICSSWGTTPIEEIAAEAKKIGGTLWFQLYVYRDRVATENLIKRANAAGVKALVLTVDTPVLGRRLADTYNGFSLPPPLKFANFESADNKCMPGGSAGESGFMKYVSSQIDPSLDWSTLRWIKTKTNLPIIVKGVMREDDVKLAIAAGVDGIIVSNHGGRQLDSAPATIEALPGVVRAADGKIPVFLDGGVRTGTDVLKAVALGATGVFVGRPVLWGLSVNGAEGVEHVLNILQGEFKHCMQLAGYRSIRELQSEKDVVVHTSFYSKL